MHNTMTKWQKKFDIQKILQSRQLKHKQNNGALMGALTGKVERFTFCFTANEPCHLSPRATKAPRIRIIIWIFPPDIFVKLNQNINKYWIVPTITNGCCHIWNIFSVIMKIKIKDHDKFLCKFEYKMDVQTQIHFQIQLCRGNAAQNQILAK